LWAPSRRSFSSKRRFTLLVASAESAVRRAAASVSGERVPPRESCIARIPRHASAMKNRVSGVSAAPGSSAKKLVQSRAASQ
jgi:hypothetical protein